MFCGPVRDVRGALWSGAAIAVVLVAAGMAVYFISPSTCPCGSPPVAVGAVTSPASATEPATQAKTAMPRMVDLGAGKCIPCKMMAPILDELRAEFAGKLDVVFIDVWQNPKAGEPYKIRLIPTQVFYDASGKELFRHEGFFSKDDILAKWKELGYDFSIPAATTAPASTK